MEVSTTGPQTTKSSTIEHILVYTDSILSGFKRTLHQQNTNLLYSTFRLLFCTFTTCNSFKPIYLSWETVGWISKSSQKYKKIVQKWGFKSSDVPALAWGQRPGQAKPKKAGPSRAWSLAWDGLGRGLGSKIVGDVLKLNFNYFFLVLYNWKFFLKKVQLMPRNLRDLLPDMLSHPIRFTGHVCARLLPSFCSGKSPQSMLSSWCGQTNWWRRR